MSLKRETCFVEGEFSTVGDEYLPWKANLCTEKWICPIGDGYLS